MNATTHVLSLLGIGYYQAPAHTDITPYQIPPGMEVIELLLGGGVMFTEDGTDQEWNIGSMFWHVGGDETIHRNLPERPYRCMVFRFDVRQTPRRQVPRCSTWADPQQAVGFCWDMFNAYHGGRANDQILSNYIYSRLLWEGYRHAPQEENQTIPEVLVQVIRFVETHFQEDLQTADLAAAGDISVPHLHQLFRQYLQTTPHQYVLQRKINHACMLLAGSTQSIKQLALECGFANIETFYRVFRKYQSQTPTEYRVQHTYS